MAMTVKTKPYGYLIQNLTTGSITVTSLQMVEIGTITYLPAQNSPTTTPYMKLYDKDGDTFWTLPANLSISAIGPLTDFMAPMRVNEINFYCTVTADTGANLLIKVK